MKSADNMFDKHRNLQSVVINYSDHVDGNKLMCLRAASGISGVSKNICVVVDRDFDDIADGKYTTETLLRTDGSCREYYVIDRDIVDSGLASLKINDFSEEDFVAVRSDAEFLYCLRAYVLFNNRGRKFSKAKAKDFLDGRLDRSKILAKNKVDVAQEEISVLGKKSDVEYPAHKNDIFFCFEQYLRGSRSRNINPSDKSIQLAFEAVSYGKCLDAALFREIESRFR